jgi:hypothetical protein
MSSQNRVLARPLDFVGKGAGFSYNAAPQVTSQAFLATVDSDCDDNNERTSVGLDTSCKKSADCNRRGRPGGVGIFRKAFSQRRWLESCAGTAVYGAWSGTPVLRRKFSWPERTISEGQSSGGWKEKR